MRHFEAVAELLNRFELRQVFGLVGSSNVAWIASGVEHGHFTFSQTRHEEAAVAAATGYARVTGEMAVATVTVGPGFANAVNALIAAAHDHVPMILVTGHGKRNVNQRGICDALGINIWEVSASPSDPDLEVAFGEAWVEAQRSGKPQVLSIEEALLDHDIELSPWMGPPQIVHEETSPESISAAVDALAEAKYPLILAGWGAMRANCRDQLVELGEATGAWLATTLNANGYFSGASNNLGVCGQSSHSSILKELEKVDVVLSVGASLNDRTTVGGALFRFAKIIQCESNIENEFKASSPEFGLLGDAKITVELLVGEVRRRQLHKPITERPIGSLTGAQDEIMSASGVQDSDPARGLDVRDVYSALNQLLPSTRTIVTDGGRAERLSATLLDLPLGSHWVPSRGHGSIGLGLGAAIGAAVADSRNSVSLFCGDGGFMMAAQELDSVRLNELNVTIVVLNDEQYGSEIKHLDKYNLKHNVARQTLPDVVALARAFGGDGIVLKTQHDLEAVKLPLTGLYVIDARIDPAQDASAFL